MYRLTVNDLSKRFGDRKVINHISFDLATGDSMAIVGANGSGKSTLLMLLLAALHPTKGSIEYLDNERKMTDSEVRANTSLVSPYLNLYDGLTAEENLRFFCTVAGGHITGKEVNSLLARVGLEGRGDDAVSSYSSGMKQRLKYAVALLNGPAFLFLDEPTSNLDDAGKKIVRDIVEEYRSRTIILIATNEKEEQSLAHKLCRVDQ